VPASSPADRAPKPTDAADEIVDEGRGGIEADVIGRAGGKVENAREVGVLPGKLDTLGASPKRLGLILLYGTGG
jgi:hypothetical protein